VATLTYKHAGSVFSGRVTHVPRGQNGGFQPGTYFFGNFYKETGVFPVVSCGVEDGRVWK
jgi:hypothetical protein